MNLDKMRRQVDRAAEDSRPNPPVTIVDVSSTWRPFVNGCRNAERSMQDYAAEFRRLVTP